MQGYNDILSILANLVVTTGFVFTILYGWLRHRFVGIEKFNKLELDLKTASARQEEAMNAIEDKLNLILKLMEGKSK